MNRESAEENKMSIKRKRTVLWTVSALWMTLIFCMSAMPGDVSGAQSSMITQLLASGLLPFFQADAQTLYALETLVRKGAHMAEYAVLFLLLRASLRLSGVRRSGFKALIMTVGYAATDEFHQRFVPGRGPSVIDVAVDACGALLAWGLSALVNRKKKEKR